MIDVVRTGRAGRLAIAVICCALLSLALAATGNCAASPALSAAEQETLRQGERIYREGILPSGEPLLTSAAGGAPVPGSSYACVSCHLRSGMGSLENGILTPPATGVKLFKPLQVYSSAATKARLTTSPKLRSYQVVQRRPQYTDQSLAHALRSGVDSAGRTMNEYMPRYPLDDQSMAALIAYLKSLSAEFSPGVVGKPLRTTPWKTETTLRLATILNEDVSIAEQTALLMPLNNFIRNMNMDLSAHGADWAPGERASDYGSRLAAAGSPSQLAVDPPKLSLSRWVLKGAPESWRAQLEQYNRKEPVFAIVGGIAHGDWQPMHQFCEENRIPCIFPMTDFPVVSPTDWYTLYFSKGYYQEGEGAAHFLREDAELQGKPIVQVVRDSREGRALSEGFLKTWHDLGQRAPVTVTLKPGEPLSAEALRQTLSRVKPGVLLLWDGPESAATLELLAAEKNRPPLVLASASFWGQSLFSLPEKVRDFTYLTYPYRISLTPEELSHLPKDSSGQSSMALRDYRVKVEENAVAAKRISQQAYILTMTLHMALDDLRGNYYRDNLLDVIGSFMKQEVRLYERLTFAPGQRYASQGCYIVQLAERGLVKKSDLLSY